MFILHGILSQQVQENTVIKPATGARTPNSVNYRFSGHETFPCRYAWLPKAVRHLNSKPDLFSDEDDAMVKLGVGKNMVRAIRFWADAASVAHFDKQTGAFHVSSFGNEVFGDCGHDEFLEDIKTLWLIHWKLSTNSEEPLFSWHHMLNYWHRSDFTSTEALLVFKQEADRLERRLSPVTLEHHFTTFLHTYVPTRSKKGEVLEDNLDCPLVELELIQPIGERTMAETGRREAIYAFRVEEKPEISPELFIYCLHDFWNARHPDEATLSFRQVGVGEGGPGQVFKLPEHAIRDRLDAIEKDSNGQFIYQESAALQQLIRRKTPSESVILGKIYHTSKASRPL